MLPKKIDLCSMRVQVIIIPMLAIMTSCGQVSWSGSARVCQKAQTCCQLAATGVNEFQSIWSCSEVDPGLGEDQKPVTKNLTHKNHEGVVEVVMKVDQKGQWKVVNMAATNEELAKYVLSKLKEYNMQSGNKSVGQVVKYRFVFKKQA